MPLNDTHLRPLPGDTVFPDAGERETTFQAIREEIEARGEGGHDPGAFALLTATRRALAQLREADDSGDGGHTHAILLFHAWHAWAAAARPRLVTVPAARWAVESETDGEQTREGGPPREGAGFPAAGYVQFPQHLFWTRESEEDRPRPVDGFYWTRLDETLHLLGVVDPAATTGGVEVLPLPGVPMSDRGVWLSETMREEGDDFRSSIPGSELEGLYELRTAGELLKLAASLDHLVRRFPDAAAEAETPDGDPYLRIELGRPASR
jgi:hypothetical protein